MHFQFGAGDADRLASFYRDVFGWTIKDARLTSVEGGVAGPHRFISADDAGLSGGVTGVGRRASSSPWRSTTSPKRSSAPNGSGCRRGAEVESEHLRLEVAGSADSTFAMHAFVDPEGNHIQILKR